MHRLNASVVIVMAAGLAGCATATPGGAPSGVAAASGQHMKSKCGDRPADKIQIRTQDGREMEVVFDISDFFGTF